MPQPIKKIPVFSALDTLKPCARDADINPLSWYEVHVSEPDLILLDKTRDFVQGETVLFARSLGIKVETLGEIRPHRVISTNIRATLEAMYRNNELEGITVRSGEKRDDARKKIPCIVYGLGNKKRNTKQEACLFRSKDEALAYSPIVTQLKLDETTNDQDVEWSTAKIDGENASSESDEVWMAVRQGQKDLTEGYLPVARMVLESMRRKLYRMVAAVGGLAVGVRTDCMYVAREDAPAARAALLAAGFRFDCVGWDAVGALKLEHKDDICIEHMLRSRNSIPRDCPDEMIQFWDNPGPAPVCERYELNDELATYGDNGDWSEVDALMPTPGIDGCGFWREVKNVTTEDEYVECCERFFGGFRLSQPDYVHRRGPLAVEATVPGAGRRTLSWNGSNVLDKRAPVSLYAHGTRL